MDVRPSLASQEPTADVVSPNYVTLSTDHGEMRKETYRTWVALGMMGLLGVVVLKRELVSIK